MHVAQKAGGGSFYTHLAGLLVNFTPMSKLVIDKMQEAA